MLEEDTNVYVKIKNEENMNTKKTKSEEDEKFEEEYLQFVKKAVQLFKALKENDDNPNSDQFIKLWNKLDAGIEIAEILDSALYPKEFSEMFSKNDQDKIKVIWNLAEIKKFDVGDIFTDRNKKNGLVVGVFKFTVWILFE